MGKKNILTWAILLMVFSGGMAFAEEKKSKEQASQEVRERLKAEAERKKKFKIQVVKGAGPNQKGKEVHFLDDNRQVHKRISLETKREVVTEKAKIGKTEKSYKVGRATSKDIRINSSGKFAALITNVEDTSEYDESGNAQSVDGGYVSGKIALLDEHGNTIWENQLPDKRQVGTEPAVSDDGEIVVAEGLLLMGGESEDPAETLFVFDKTGKEILRVPTKKDQKPNEKLFYIRIEKLSANGKYLAATFTHGRSSAYPLFTRFYNLTNKKYWDAGKEYVVYEIHNDGVCSVSENIKGSKGIDIDLKNYIGD